MWRTLPVVVALAACHGAPATPDARPDGYTGGSCSIVQGVVSCVAGTATADFLWLGGSSQTNGCAHSDHTTAACAQGCAIAAMLQLQGAAPELVRFAGAPAVLCAETPEAHAGDTCATGTSPCLPTRAELNPDGTVAAHHDLDCVSGSCAPVSPPVIAQYLAPCDAALLAQYGTSGAKGIVASAYGTACLLAWDDATQAITSGQTVECVGDWECPETALCDDLVPVIASPWTATAVCKPGPRGTLTPAMLAR